MPVFRFHSPARIARNRNLCRRLYLTTAGTGPGYIEVSEFINTAAAGEGFASASVNGIPGLHACGGQTWLLQMATTRTFPN